MGNPVIWLIWSVLVSYFYFDCALAMPQYEPGQFVNAAADSGIDYGDAFTLEKITEVNNSNSSSGADAANITSEDIPVSSSATPPLLQQDVTSNNSNTEPNLTTNQILQTTFDVFPVETETATPSASPSSTSSTAELETTLSENVNSTQSTPPESTSDISYLPNEISIPPATHQPKQEITQENLEQDDDPLLVLPSVSTPVIDPIAFSPQPQQNEQPVSYFEDTFPFVTRGVNADSPSIQLIPPSQQPSPNPPAIPEEPEKGQVPESPEPQQPNHPYNLRDIPITLLSLSGNSGGSTSDMATFSSLVSLTENVPVDFTRFRYHVVTGQLLKIGSTGPGICPGNMRFFAVPGHPKNGACDCDYYQCSRPLIYSVEQHQCYWAWSQGPCETGEWWVFDKHLKRRGKCQKNPCPTSAIPSKNDTSKYYFQSPEDTACYQEGTKGYCEDEDERLLTYPGEPIPKCRKFTVCYPLTVPQELQCIYGNKYYVESGQCQ